jgi:histidine phosphotransferase ChpT
MAETSSATPLALAQVVCTRLCHDLGGPVGALAGALDLVEGPNDDALDVARDAVRIIDRRLRFWRVAVGGAATDLDAAAIAQLAEGLTLGRRASVELDGLVPGCAIPPAVAQPLLLGMLIGIEAMPRGGVLRVGGDPGDSLSVWPDGAGAAWPAGLLGLLAGDQPALTPRGVALPLLVATAAAGRVRLEILASAPKGGPGPLLLIPRR